jgi:Protein of unknown function (DUF3987)
MILPRASEEVFASLPGRVVRLSERHTEAEPVAIAVQFLIGFGNAVGHGPRFFVGETPHHLNEFLAVVGTTSRARKGDSKNAALRAIEEADPDWAHNIGSGLSSGEGLIHAVRDPVTRIATSGKEKGNEYLADPGVSDKRLLVVESEFSNALKQFSRDGNVLSCMLRDAWDAKRTLRLLTKNSPTRATDAHISIIAHTTPEDLSAYLANIEAANGLGNRFLFVLTHRARLLPNPGRAAAQDVAEVVDEVRDALLHARQVEVIRRTPAAERLWAEIYPTLTADQPGLLGKLLARSEAHVARLSALYALCALSPQIDVEHLKSALALWDYCESSTRLIFANRTGDDTADRIRSELLPGQSMSLRELRDQIFANHISAARLSEALKLLQALGEITVTTEPTEGRPRIVVTRLHTQSSTEAEAHVA